MLPINEKPVNNNEPPNFKPPPIPSEEEDHSSLIKEDTIIHGKEKLTKKRRTLSCKGTESLKDLLICPICLERFDTPKMLPCQHTFCLKCLQKCQETKGKVRCPQCRSEHLLNKTMSSLPVNIYLQSLLDVLESDGSDSIVCHECQIACSYMSECQHCNRSYCHVCLERHVTQFKGQLGQMAQQMGHTKERLQNKIDTFKKSCEILRDEIGSRFDEKLRELNEKRDLLVVGVETELQRQLEKGLKLAGDLDGIAKRLKDAEEKEFEELRSETDKMSLFMQLHQTSSNLLSEISCTSMTCLTFDPNSFEITTSQPNQNIPKETTGAEGGHSITKTTNQTKMNGDLQSQFYRTKSFHPKLKLGLGLLQRPSGIAVSPWSEEIFVVAMDNHRVFVFEMTTGKLHKSFGKRGTKNGEFLCPFGLALSPMEQLVLVTDKWKHCIHIFGKNGRFLRQLGSKGRSPGHFRSPEAICVDNNGRIYVCDTCNYRIQVLDKDGFFVIEIGTKTLDVIDSSPRMRSMFHEPTGISVTPDGRKIVVCDFGHHRVHVFSPTGDLISTFGQKGMLRGQFIHPECSAVDDKGFILIGDSGNGRVQIYRPDGSFVRSFGSKGSKEGQFSWISAIAVTSRRDIVVSDFKNHCVQIF